MTDSEKIAKLESDLAAALAEIARLTALLRKASVKKTSKNSHLCSSSEFGSSKKSQSLREKSDNPVGGQKGHAGHTLLQSENPDVIVDLRPDYCIDCGKSLVDNDFKLKSSRQVIDIPPIMAQITEYRNFETICSCGHHAVGGFPAGVTQPIQYGENIQSLCVYQNIFQYMPFGRMQDFFQSVCNLSISKGTLENIIRRTSDKATPVYEHLRQVTERSFYVGSDETSFKCNGDKHWFWVWQTTFITYIVAASSRAKQVIVDTFPQGLTNSILGSDRLAAQLSTPTKGFQLCLVHLLRDLQYLIDLEKTPWAIAFKILLKDAIKLKQDKIAYLPTDKEYLNIIHTAETLLKLTVLEESLTNEIEHKETLIFFAQMRNLRKGLFPFLLDARIPFHNNDSEKAIRNVKVKMKISGQFKSLHTQFAILRSVIDTARKNGQPVFNAIRAIIALNPVAN